MRIDETGTNNEPSDPSADGGPAPGSAEALERGCACSPRANRHGKRPPFAPGTAIGGSTGGWMIAANCTLHVNSAYRGALITKLGHMRKGDLGIQLILGTSEHKVGDSAQIAPRIFFAGSALRTDRTFLVPANNAGISAYMVSVVPDELQGRVNSAAGFIANALVPLGPVLASVALALVGGVTSLLIGAVATAATALPLLASRTIRELGPPDRWDSSQP